ncbi:MAG: DUF1559 domain-containing protein [Pirellulales bacterium]
MRTYCRLSQLRLALVNYEYANGTLPPRQLTDADGVPQFGWLVSILPQIEHANVLAALDLSKRWDDPHNLAIGQRRNHLARAVKLESQEK